MKTNSYHIGNLRDESLNGDNGGWIVGSFMKDPSLYRPDIEVKYFEYKKGQATNHPAKVSTVVEWTYILSGSMAGFVGDHKVVLRAGDYVLIHPNTANNLAESVLEDVAGITIKAPSDPSAKKIITID